MYTSIPISLYMYCFIDKNIYIYIYVYIYIERVFLSKAQQSCVSATAPEQKIMRGLRIRINRKSWRKMIKKRSKHRSETYQISVQNRPKTDQKPIENHLKIHSKSFKNLSTSRLERKKSRTSSWEPSWRRLGRVLGANIASSWRPKSKENR